MNIHQALLMDSAEEILALSPHSTASPEAKLKASLTGKIPTTQTPILVIKILAINARSHMAQKLPNLCKRSHRSHSSCGDFDLGDSREDCGVA